MAKRAKGLNIATGDDFFKTIGDVSSELRIPTHVLRFWESKFPEIKPVKRKGGHRYYRPQDVETIVRIKDLLYDQGYTIKGAQKHLRNYKRGKNDFGGLHEANENSVVNIREQQSLSGQRNLFGEEEAQKPKGDPKKVASFIKELESVKDMLNSN